jgi:sugar phosphate isomerase/epimerase
LAEERSLGLELQHFTHGPLLDGAWREKVSEIKAALKGFTGTLSLHGPYDNLDPGAWDPQVASISRARYLHAMQIADMLGARIIVFHCWYWPTLQYHGGVSRWAERRIPAWQDLARSAEKFGVTLVLENVWEPNPQAQITVIDAVNSPALKACLDTGHANMTGATPLPQWIEQLGPRLVYVHSHNNSGASDDHWPFDRGTLDMKAVITKLAAQPTPPRVCLELRSLADQQTSLKVIDSAIGS